MAHVLEHIPATRRDSECCKVTEVYSFLSTSTENVHGIIHKGSRMTLTGYGNVANTVELGPRVRARFIRPDIVEPCDTVCTTEAAISQNLKPESHYVSVDSTYR